MTSITNKTRAERGRQLLEYHSELLGDQFDGDYQSQLSSALADIIHFCNQNEVGFDRGVSMAYAHYEDEESGCDDYLDEDTAE